MCGPRARTNFVSNSSSSSSSSKLLSPNLTAKLHRCYMASLHLTNQSSQKLPTERRFNSGGADKAASLTAAAAEGQTDRIGDQAFEALEEDHIQQMIEELIHYGSVELCSVVPPSQAF